MNKKFCVIIISIISVLCLALGLSACAAKAEQATISKVKGGTINDLDIYMFVEHDVTEVNILRVVTCSPKSTWKLYEDKRGQREIATKIASGENDELKNGDNVFYIVVTSENGIVVNTYTLTIHRSYAITVKYYNGNVLDRTDIVYTGHEYTTDYAPEYRGYTFNGWKNGGETFTSAVLWDNLELHADKTAHTFNVSFVTDEKAQEVESFTVVYDQEVTLPTSSKTGYTFNGWLDGDAISENTFVWNFIEDKEYSAKFTANEYTITYIPNGGTLKSTTQKVTYDSEYTLYEMGSRLGYTFEGYTYNGESFTSGVWNTAENITLNAEWEIITYTITYNYDERTINPEANPATYTVEDNFVFANGTKTGYTFNGWYSEESCTNIMTKIYKGTIGDKILYAKTTANEYTITYIPNGGTLKSTTQKVTYDSEYTLYEMGSRLGYTFEGYTYNGESFTSGVWNTAENITLNAEWNVLAEMQNFDFTSTATTCNIVGVKDKAVTEIVVPDYVTSIGESAFSGCNGLTSITIPFVGESRKTSTDTYQYPFGYIFGKSSYTGGTATTQYYYGSNAINSTSTTYYIPTSLKSVTITGGNILYGAFRSCDGLTSITIPDGVTSIGDWAFYYCDGLTSITIPDSVTSIGSHAFSNCSRLTSVTIPDSVTSIGSHVFSNCDGLTSITIPDSVTTIGDWAFFGCRVLTSVTIGNGVTSIGESAFNSCSGLTSITVSTGNATFYSSGNCVIEKARKIVILGCKNSVIPSDGSILVIGDYAFSGCYWLTSIAIPDSVTSIGSHAFSYCDRLTSVTIGNSVTSIGDSAFYYCKKLKSVYYKGTAEEWGKITVGSDNNNLKNATRYYYSADPVTGGNYWHYDADGVTPVVW